MTDRLERSVISERPGSPRRQQRRRAVLASFFALLLTPVAIGIAANGAVLAGRWWDAADRWLAPAQSVLGALLLSVVAGSAIYVPAAALTAGLVWGIVPAIVQIAAPASTYRLISAVPGLPAELSRVLHSWLSSGVILLFGVLLCGIGAVALLRKRYAG
ncbi:hypothetical protein [Nocardia sp. NBC_00416]|uniref:hypothetical protein n=1 Tax=Nocardia sp. NBC_00416 TaxID=2975991 RepID=UPI002E1C4CD1